MRGERTRACEHLRRRRPPPGIPRPVRLGRRTKHGREHRLRLTQRDPALTQRAELHDKHTMPSAQAAVKRGGGAGRTSVSQSLSPTGHCVRRTFAEGVANVGTISEFSRKVARPAGFEPATIGLEGRAFRSGGTTRYNAVQRVVFSGRFQVDPGGGRAAVPDRRAQGRTGGQDRRSAAEAGSRSGRAWPVARAPPAAVDSRPIRRSARTRSIVPHRSPWLPVAPTHSASLSRPPERGWPDGRPPAAATQEGPLP